MRALDSLEQDHRLLWRLTEALEAYEKAAELQPENWRAIKGIGIVLDRMGKPEAATVAYQRARDAQKK